MNPLVVLGAGGLVAYLLLRHKDAAAAALSPVAMPPALTPIAQPPLLVVAAPAPTAIPPSTAPVHITTLPASPARSETPASSPSAPIQLTGRWGWPVPRWQGRAPVISDGYGSPRPGMLHAGVDLMFARISSDPFPIGVNGSKLFVMPDAWPAVAAADGVLWSAGPSPRGYSVVIDHGTVATFYQHLSTLMVPVTSPPAKGTPRDRMIPIKAGQPLGVIGGDPTNPPHLKHLHFEVWPAGPSSAIDPAAVMRSWQIFEPRDVLPLFPAARNAAKRKARKDGDLVHVTEYFRAYPGAAVRPGPR